jgi:hypothetical protein
MVGCASDTIARKGSLFRLVSGHVSCRYGVAAVALAFGLAGGMAFSQAITIDTNAKGNTAKISGTPVDHQYQQIQPTKVDLPTTPMGEKSRLEVLRVMEAEQGFAMRPLPKGHKGLTLKANGELDPAGEAYLNMVTSEGVSVKPGGRVVVTDVKIDKDKLIFDLNGGPDPKHRFLRHVQLGTDPNYANPVVTDDASPVGSRLTLTFKDRVPEVSGAQVKQLLAPLISFDVKSPAKAYTDTLPDALKQAILDHQALVGMNIDMLMFAKGQPKNKMREMDGQMPIEIWLYGTPPEDVTFVRINGNRVIRVEIAKVGKPVQVFEQDVVTPILQAQGKQPVEEAQNIKVVKEGDVQRDPQRQAPAPAPTLAGPGENLPAGAGQDPNSQMKPVHFPKKQPDSVPGANPDDQEPGAAQGTPQAQTPANPGQPGGSKPN